MDAGVVQPQKFGSLRSSLGWSARNLKRNPADIIGIGWLAIRSHLLGGKHDAKILVATHHKVLTVYFANIFRHFALLTNRSMSSSHGNDVHYNADILRSTHSRFDFAALGSAWFGVHVVRDPRDMLVSAAKYHLRSREPWLHVPQEQFGGKTYQQAISSLETPEERLLFELHHAGAANIRDMLAWDYDRPGMAELRYEDLIRPDGLRTFRSAVEGWDLSATEKRLLCRLFEHYSIYGSGAKNQAHIRNPAAGQWRDAFTPRVEAAFEAKFPGAVQQLGYA